MLLGGARPARQLYLPGGTIALADLAPIVEYPASAQFGRPLSPDHAAMRSRLGRDVERVVSAIHQTTPRKTWMQNERGSELADENLTLYVAGYNDPAAATADFKSLKEAQEADEFDIVGSVVLSRDDDGNVTVKETGTGQTGAGAWIGGGAGLIVGLFAPPLLLATALGAAIGAGIGHLVKKHDEKQMGADVEEYLPPGTSAILVVIDDQYLDNVESALTKADKKLNKAIDSGDYDDIQKAIADAADNVDDAIDS